MTYDLIIIGAGPAGITAGIYAARKNMSLLIITRDIGGQASLSSDVENYTGYQFVTGMELSEKFSEHLKKFNIEVKELEAVETIEKNGSIFDIKTDSGSYQARSVIITSGRIPRKLNVPGEEEFKNRGVTYCATCDGPLFAKKTIAVIGGGNSALDAVLQMIKIADKIHLITVESELRADPVMTQKVKNNPKVIIYTNTKLQEIYGEKAVKGIKILQNGQVSDLPVGGIFIEIGSLPVSDIIKDVAKNESGEIQVNCKCETNIPGLFAAGDVTSVPAKQIIVACGEGAKASISAFDYLSKTPD
ncbi:MAG: hypothetical protein A2252_09745 [Elusimicrobia bacterium RIFOXYA2_FULL_39_19]|nr:MAG: hypothetical protein A2252_09745 [Elusimicrobia bacterium RIFOXYA2_FULL_39_19]